MLKEEKAALRRATMGVLRALEPAERASRSVAVTTRYAALPEWRDSREVLGYFPMSVEVDVLPLLESALGEGRKVWLPRIEEGRLVFRRVHDLDGDLETHPYGMREPLARLEAFDPSSAEGAVIVVTPGLAFDAGGHRLGRGKGYYDAFLGSARGSARVPFRAIAVAFAEQVVPSVPHGERDMKVDAVVTDRDLLRAPRR